MEQLKRLLNCDRSQTESIGIVLLTAVIAIVVSVSGMYYLSSVEGDGDQPKFSVEGDVSAPNVTVTHAGGDPIPSGDLRLVVRVDDSSVYTETYDQEFTPGDTWTVNVSNHTNVTTGSTIGVSLYHVPSGSQLYSEAWTADEEWSSITKLSQYPRQLLATHRKPAKPFVPAKTIR